MARSSLIAFSRTSSAVWKRHPFKVCCQSVTLGALSSRSALSVLVGALFKKFGLSLNTPHVTIMLMRFCEHFERNVRIYWSEQKLEGVTLTFHVKYFFSP
jgi:hypothetical protein